MEPITCNFPRRLRSWTRRAARSKAFTRLELCGILAALALMAGVALPVLAGNRSRADRVVCANNLRQIGNAFTLWGHERGDTVPFEVPTAEGGTMLHPLSANTWLHFSVLSNELNSAGILNCPSDATGVTARDFSLDPSGGYLHPNYRNRATSYFLSHWFTPSSSAILAGDRNITRDTVTSCSRFGTVVGIYSSPVRRDIGWLTGLHEGQGNLLHFDGRVQQANSAGFQQAIAEPQSDNGTAHFLLPR